MVTACLQFGTFTSVVRVYKALIAQVRISDYKQL
jgi:hypothetical protein